MRYHRYNLNSYNFHILKSDKFKTVSILVSFRRPIVKEEVTIRNLLPLLLSQSTKNFPTNRLLSTYVEKLYGLNLNINNQRLGNYALMSFEVMMINEKYLEEGMYEKKLDFLFEILFNPNVDLEAFDEKSFNIAKNELTSMLKSIKDNTTKYSLIRMLEEMDSKAPASYRFGYIEDIEKITPQKAYEYYKDLLKSDEVDVFILGDVDIIQTKRIFREKFKINTIKKNKENLICEHSKYRRRINKIKEKGDIKQAKLAIGCKLKNLTDYERKYVMPIYANILGGPSSSKLFKSIRKEKSLAYHVGCNYIMADNNLLIYAGIDKDNFDMALSIIKKEIGNIVKGNITSEELETAKQEINSFIEAKEDSPLLVISSYLLMELLDFDDFKTRKKKNKLVTIEDLKKVAKKVSMDTVYLLYGDE